MYCSERECGEYKGRAGMLAFPEIELIEHVCFVVDLAGDDSTRLDSLANDLLPPPTVRQVYEEWSIAQPRSYPGYLVSSTTPLRRRPTCS